MVVSLVQVGSTPGLGPREMQIRVLHDTLMLGKVGILERGARPMCCIPCLIAKIVGWGLKITAFVLLVKISVRLKRGVPQAA